MNQKYIINVIYKIMNKYKYIFIPSMMLRPFFLNLDKHKNLIGVEIGNAYGFNANKKQHPKLFIKREVRR